MKFGLLPAILGMTASVAACTPAVKAVPGPSTLRVGILNAPHSLQSWSIRDGASSMVGGQIHRGLLVVDPETGGYSPYAASSWQIQPNGNEIRFQLRQGLLFHDGTPLTCQDTRDSLLRLTDPKLDVAARLPDGIRITCNADETLSLSMKPVPAKLLDILASPTAGISKADGLTGIGPYRLQKTMDKAIELTRHWGSGPEVIEFKIATSDELVAGFKEGKIDDLLYLGLFHSVDLPCQRISGLSPTSFWVGVNSREWSFSKRTIRRSALELVRQGLILDNIFSAEIRNDTIIPFGVVGSRMPSSVGTADRIPQLKAELKRTVAAHGRIPFTLRKAHQQSFEWNRLFDRIDPDRSIFEPVFLSNDDFFKEYFKGKLALFVIGASVSRNDPFEVLSYFRVKDSNNQTGNSDPYIDRLSERALQVTTSEEVAELAQRGSQWLVDEGYVLPLFSKRFSGCVRPNLKGYHLSTLGPLSIDYSRVRMGDG